MATYSLTDADRAQLKPWADKWIANALSTKMMDAEDREKMVLAINGLYEAAKLAKPKHIVFLPSPLALALAGSFAAAIWHVRRHGLPKDEKDAEAATDGKAQKAEPADGDAHAQEMRNSLSSAMNGDTMPSAATIEATVKATLEATRPPEDAASDAASIESAGRAARSAAVAAITRKKDNLSPLSTFMLQCCQRYYNLWNGGNQWSGWVAYLSFFRHVAKLELPEYEAFQHYEAAAIHGGPRMMHADFCMISDRPDVLCVDDQNRPHCATGPSHRWRDGWSLWYWHGVKVPQQVIETPDTMTIEQVDGEQNAEVRRVMIERMGMRKYMTLADAKIVDTDVHDHNGMRALMRTRHGTYLTCACASTGRVYQMEVDGKCNTCEEADKYLRGPALQEGTRQVGAT